MADTATRQEAGSVDKRMEGIDSDPDTFDPTEGESPALTRNNNNEVWVQQVRNRKQGSFKKVQFVCMAKLNLVCIVCAESSSSS
jgi:hypothetical protein